MQAVNWIVNAAMVTVDAIYGKESLEEAIETSDQDTLLDEIVDALEKITDGVHLLINGGNGAIPLANGAVIVSYSLLGITILKYLDKEKINAQQ